jgi:hypothetical protein
MNYTVVFFVIVMSILFLCFLGWIWWSIFKKLRYLWQHKDTISTSPKHRMHYYGADALKRIAILLGILAGIVGMIYLEHVFLS